ncbi:Transmembrane protease serine 9 [Halotydeus destructor]|nr:Transmembrane protease serine 9 [Halotydeus destructor]
MPVLYIRTPGYPEKNYPSKFAVSYNISYEDGYTLEMTFEHFVLQTSDNCAKDYVDLVDGQRSDTLCGNRTGQVFEFHGQQNLTFTFQSDFQIEASGYYIRLAITRPTCRCGQANYAEVKTRIYGGEELEPKNKYPWLVSIANEKGNHICGGTIISDRYILTAAHCFKDEKGQFNSALNTRVVLGGHDLKKDPKKVIQPFDVILHDEYVNTGYNIRNDIALIRLADPIVFNSKIRPVCLPPPSMGGPYTNLSVAGWGQTAKLPVSDIPMEVFVPEVDFDRCQKYHGFRVKKGKVVCAGGLKGKDSCVGDSGGPLMSHVNGTVYLVGVVSFGDSCGEVGKYGVYTKVTQFLDWIAESAPDSWTCPRQEVVVPKPDAPVPKPEVTTLKPVVATPKPQVLEPQPEERICGKTENRLDSVPMPWMAAIGYDSQYLCTATYIGSNYVLTSGSTVHSLQSRLDYVRKKISVVMGTRDLFKSTTKVKIYRVVEIITNEKLNVSLLQLNSDGPVDKYYSPICLPKKQGATETVSTFLSAGWGRTSPGGQSSNLMKVLKLSRTSGQCSTSDKADTICTATASGSLCQGDEGAPLIYLDNNLHYLGGVLTATSTESCISGRANAYTDTRKILDWVQAYVTV